MLRRREEYQPDRREFGDLVLDSGSSELCCEDRKIVLPKVEYQMMEVLMLNHGIYLSSEDLLEKVWGYDTEADIGAVWVYISYLRKRIAAVGSKVKITAKRNIGYTLTF